MNLFSIFRKPPSQADVIWQMAFEHFLVSTDKVEFAAQEANKAVEAFKARPQ